MVFDSKQVSLLTEMGIPVWALRTHQGITSEKVEPPILLVDNTAFLNKVSQATWLVCHDGSDNPQAQRLLQAMLATIGVSYGEACLMTTSDIDIVKTTTTINWAQKVLLVLGEQAVRQTFGDEATVATYRNETHFISQSKLATMVSFGLTDLMQHPENKVSAWQDLQLAKIAQQAA